MPRKNLTEYPTSWGDKKVCLFVHQGPLSYVAVALDLNNFPTGGDPVTAAEAGIKTFEALIPLGVSFPNLYRVEVVYPNGNTPGSGTGAVPSQTVLLRWIDPQISSTDLQEIADEVDLTGESVRLLAIGPK